MTALVAADVTITVERRSIEGKTRRNRVKIAFGDAALTIPSGGVPLPTFASFGMKRNLDYLTIFDDNDASGILWKYDKDNNKLRAYNAGVAHAHDISLKCGASAQVTSGTMSIETAANSRLVRSGPDAIISGADSATDGGVVTTSATVATEDTSSAPAAQVLYAEAVGW